jgi:hypothetical protein
MDFKEIEKLEENKRKTIKENAKKKDLALKEKGKREVETKAKSKKGKSGFDFYKTNPRTMLDPDLEVVEFLNSLGEVREFKVIAPSTNQRIVYYLI